MHDYYIREHLSAAQAQNENNTVSQGNFTEQNSITNINQSQMYTFTKTTTLPKKSKMPMQMLWLLFFTAILGLQVSKVNGQASIANYTYSTNATGSLEDLSSGATVHLGPAGVFDSGAGEVTPIGFPFVFMGKVYTHFSANANGQMRLHLAGEAAIATTSVSSYTANVNTLAPFAGDNEVGEGIRYKVIGTAPNRKLVVEWIKFYVSFTNIDNAGNMQAWIEESTGNISYVYGEIYNSNSASQTRSIFLASSNTATTSGHILLNTSPTEPTFVPAAAPVTNSIAAGSGSTTGSPLIAQIGSSSQGSRRVFNWAAPSSSGLASPSGLAISSSTITTQTLTWSAASPTTGIANYTVLGSTDGGTTWIVAANVAVGTNTYTATGLEPNTNYTWRVYSNNEGQFSSGFTEESGSTSPCSVSGTKSIGTGGDYTTLTAALADIKLNGAAGNIILELNSSYVSTSETFPLILNKFPCASSGNTVTIRPATGVTGRIISSTNATATVSIDSGSYYIIDGRPGGTGSAKELTIQNTSTTAAARSLLFINDASNNIIRYVKLNNTSNATSTTSAIVAFSTARTGGSGNDNNTIEFCDVQGNSATSATAGPQNGIYSLGTASTSNSGNVIQNNNIFDVFFASSSSNGINLGSNNENWTISGNSYYMTGTRTTTTGSNIIGINISSATLNSGHTISGNYIGGSTASAGGSAMTLTGTVAVRFRGISLAGTTAGATITVQNNIIANHNFTSNTSATTTGGPWVGIYNSGGPAVITGNTIGSGTGTGNITLNPVTTSGGVSNGIFSDVNVNLTVSNNTIGSVTLAGSIACGFNAIGASLGAQVYITGNTIGSTGTANSINITTTNTGTTAPVLSGINITGGTGNFRITGNTIANLRNGYLPAAANTSTIVRGIWTSSGIDSIAGNTVRDLTTGANATGTGITASVIGIGNSSATVGTSYITANTVHSLSNTNNSASAIQVTGIVSASSGFVNRNLVYSLSSPSTTAASMITGIHAVSSTVNYQNNMVRLGVNATTATPISGILESGGINDFWHNTVYIGGTGVPASPGTSSTYAFYNNASLTSVRNIQNNILINERTCASTGAKHYAIRIGGTTTNPTGLTINHNLYRATGTFTGVFGFYNGSDVTDLAAWQTAVGQDANSITADPCLANPTASTPDLHLTDCSAAGSPADGSGTDVGVAIDFDTDIRTNLTPTDIGADAGNYGLIGVDVGVSALISPAADSCYSATQTIKVELKNYGVNTIDFSVNNVTVTVTATGGYNESVIINSGTLASNGTQEVTLPVTIDMSGAGTYVLNASATVSGDVNTSNDALPTITRYVLGGSYTVGTGGDFSTLTDAIASYNSSCIVSAVTFNLTNATYNTAGGEVFPIVIEANEFASSTNTLTIRPAAGNAATITGATLVTGSALIKLNGADHIIIDGINTGGASLTIENTATLAGSTTIWLASTGEGQGATNNIIRNTSIKGGATQNTGTVVTAGIVIAGPTLSTVVTSFAAGLDNDNNTITANTFTKLRYGIFTRGGSNSNPNTGTVITNNIFGPTAFGTESIGKGGVVIREEDGIVISGNTFRFIGGDYANSSAGTDRAAIAMGTDVNWTPTTVMVKNAVITNNKIHDIIDERTFSAIGILVAGTDGSNPTNNLVANNMIYNVKANGTASDQTLGIGIGAGNNDNIVFNTIYLTGDTDPDAAASSPTISGFGISVTAAANLNLKNNIVHVNLWSSSASTLKFAAINIPASFDWGTGGSNYNNLYIDQDSTRLNVGAIGGSTGTFYKTFAEWKTASSQDAASKNVLPVFVSSTDLHLVPLYSNDFNNAGVPVSGVTTDIDGDTRNVTNPDLGADEFDPPLGVDMGVTALVSPNNNGCYTAAETVTVTIKNHSFNVIDFSVDSITVHVTATGGYVDSFVVNTGTLGALATMNVSMPTTIDLTTYGNYTFNAYTAYSGTDLIPANDAMAAVVIISVAPTAGTVTADKTDYCLTGGYPVLTLSSAIGGSIQWQESTDSTNWVNVGTDSLGYVVQDSIYTNTWYRAIVFCGLQSDTSNALKVTFHYPQLTGTTGASRCGTGSVTLGATSNAGSTLHWYASPTGGSILGTGTSFNTPVINSTTDFYVAAATEAGGSASVGKETPIASPTSFVGSGVTQAGLVFDALAPFTLKSVVVYPNHATAGTPGTLTIDVVDASNNIIHTATVDVVGYPTTDLNGQRVNLNFDIVAGTNLKLRLGGRTGVTGVSFDPSSSGPYAYPYTVDGVLSINHSTVSAPPANTSNGVYYMFYDWEVSTGCETPRTAVTATVIAAPTISASATDDNLCLGESTTLNASSSNGDYSYSWSPATSPATGASVTATPTVTTTYTLNATDTSGGTYTGCNALPVTVQVTVNPVPNNVVISNDTTICVGASVTLTATSGQNVSGTIGTQTTTIGGAVGNPYRSGYTANTRAKNQILYTAAELTAIGLQAGNITAIGFNATTVAATTELYDFTIHMANTTETALVTASMAAPIGTQVYTYPGTFFAPVLGLNTHTFQTPFNWDGTSNVLVTVCTRLQSVTTTTNVSTFAATGMNTQQVGTNVTDCSVNIATQAASSKPVMYVAGNTAAPITWSPSTYLNTTSGNTVISTPAAPITYIATATLGTCTKVDSVTVSLNDLSVSATHTDADCFGAATGTITATGNGGVAPYQYSIDGTTWQSSNVFTGVTAGAYTIYIKDNSTPNCTVSGNTVTVLQPAAIVVSIDASSDPVCNNASDGTITASATGGTGTIEYSLDGNTYQAGGSFTGLAAGNYTVYARDANGCTGTTPVTLNNPAPPAVTASNNGPVCEGNDITLTATAGYASYAWSGPGTINNSTDSVATAVAPNDGDKFYVTITDSNGCTNTDSTTVSVTSNLPASVTLSVDPGTDICPGGYVTFTANPVNGGTSPTYQWYLNGVAVPDSTNSTYQSNAFADGDQIHVVMTSDITCVTGSPANSDTATITIAGFIFASVDSLVASANNICSGTQVTYTAYASGTGAFPVYDFYVNAVLTQSSGSNTFTYTPNHGDEVYVIMTSSFSCALGSPANSSVISMTVYTTPSAPVITPDGPVTFCNGNSVVLSSSFTGSGNVWSPGGATTDQITVTTSGTYTVIYTSGDGCVSPVSEPVVVTVNDNPVATITGNNAYCLGDSTLLSAATSVAGSGTITSYQWTLDGITPLGTEATQMATTPGSYTVTVTNSNGCITTSAAHVVTEATPPAVSISSSCTTIYPGQAVTLTASPSGLDYAWSLNGGSTLSTANPYVTSGATGTYKVVVTDISSGCIVEDSITISANSAPLAGGSTYTIPGGCGEFPSIASAVQHISTYGVTGTGTITFNVTGGHTETTPVGGIVWNQCALHDTLKTNASLSVVFQRSGVGANPLITAEIGTGSNDPIFALAGADYVTIDGIDLVANPGATTGVQMPEWGYLLTNCSGTDGAQYNTIKNSTVTLNKTNGSVHAGIAILNNSVAVTAASGTNSYNTIQANTVTNALNGIRLFGYNDPAQPYSFYDQGNQILGNTVTNFGRGTTSTQSNGIYAERNNNLKINDNTVNSTGSGLTHIGAINGIGTGAARWANVEIRRNTVTVVSAVSSTGTSGMNGINNLSGNRSPQDSLTAPQNTVLIDSNIVQNCNYQSGKGFFRAIMNNRSGDTLTAYNTIITNNRILNNTSSSDTASAFVFSGIFSQPSGSVYNVSNNLISGNNWTGTPSIAANCRMIVLSWGWDVPTAANWVETKTISNNRIINNGSTSLSGPFTGINLEGNLSGGGTMGVGTSATISNNYVGDMTMPTTTGSFSGILSTSAANIKVVMTNDTVNNVVRNSATTGAFDGIRSTGLCKENIFDNNRVTNNSMTGATTLVFNGITATGSTTATDTTAMNGNTVSGNTIAGTGAFTAINGGTLGGGITMNNNSVVNNQKTGTSGVFDGLVFGGSTTLTTNLSMNNNIVSGNTSNGTSTMSCLDAGSAVRYSITNNTVSNNAKTTGTSGIFIGMVAGGSTTSTTNMVFDGNIITGNTQQGTSDMTMMYATSAVKYFITNNQVYNNSKLGASGTMFNTRAGGSTTSEVTYSNNQVYNNSMPNTSGTTAANIYGFYQFASPGVSETYTNNQIYNLTMGGTNTATTSRLFGLYTGSALTSVKTISGNVIHTLTSNVTGTGAVIVSGLVSDYGAEASQIFGNKIYNLTNSNSGTSAGLVNGIGLGFVSTTVAGKGNVFNNIIGDLKAPNSASTDAIRGISQLQTATSSGYNIYYNTIRLAATSAGANFGTTGIYHTVNATATTSAMLLKNNIVVNVSTPNGTGKTVAYRRSGTALNNYSAASNNNLFYAGTPSANWAIFFDGTNTDSTLAQFKTRVSTRETNSVTENPPFLSTIGSDATFLHIDPSVATQIEGGAENVAGITNDFDGDIRQGNPGYTGASITKPDIGADEMDGTPPPCTGADAGTTAVTTKTTCTANSATSFEPGGYSTGGGISYQWQVTTTSGSGYTDVTTGTGGTTPLYTTANNLAAGTYYYRMIVTCSAGPVSDTSVEHTLTVNQSPTALAANSGPVCSGTSITLDGTTDIGVTYSWTGPLGFTSSAVDTTFIAPVGGSGVYTFTATFNGCSVSDTTQVTITSTPVVNVNPATTALCEGQSVVLTALGQSGNITIGTANGGTISTTGTPYRTGTTVGASIRTQQLIRASELVAAGITAGSIKGITLYALSAPGGTLSSFTISMGHTTASVLSTTFNTDPVNEVFFASTYSPVNGANTHTFNTPFLWDGSSNILINWCSTLQTGGSGASIQSYNAGFVASVANNTTCTVTTGTTQTNNRAVITFDMEVPNPSVTWSPAIGLDTTGGSTVTASPVVNTNYVATASFNGCTASDTAVITISPIPGGASISGTASVCQNEASPIITFTATQGTAPYTFTYNINGGPDQTAVSAGGTNPVSVTIPAPTDVTGTFTYNLTGISDAGAGQCSGTASGSVTITIDTLPAVSFTGFSSPYCLDATAVTLTANHAGGTFSGAGITDNADGTATWSAATAGVGTHTITYSYTNSNNCTGTTTQNVTVNANVSAGTVSGTSPLCIGGTATYTSNGTAGGSWSSSDDLIATVNATTGEVTAVSAGTATITYTVNSGCGSPVSSNAVVTVNGDGNAGTITGTSPLCNGATATFTTDGDAGGTWSSTNTLVATVHPSSGLVTAVGAGSADILYVVDACGPNDTATYAVTVNNCNSIVNVTAFIEGFYTGASTMAANLYDLGISTDPTETDTIEVNLWSAASLSNPTPDYSVKVVLHTNGTASATFPGATLGNSYYIALKHRNSIETWSAAPVAVTATTNYDFSSSLSSAYDDGVNAPMRSVAGGKFAIYGGDVNQDGTVDALDQVEVVNDAGAFAFGYNATDCTGDGATDAFDQIIVVNNASLFLFYARPY